MKAPTYLWPWSVSTVAERVTVRVSMTETGAPGLCYVGPARPHRADAPPDERDPARWPHSSYPRHCPIVTATTRWTTIIGACADKSSIRCSVVDWVQRGWTAREASRDHSPRQDPCSRPRRRSTPL